MKKILLITSLLVNTTLYSQKDTMFISDSSSNTVLAPTDDFLDPEETEQSITFTSSKEFWLGISILLVLILILILITAIIHKKNISDELSVKLLLTTVVILSSLFLVVAGYNDRTIAPAFGLFGAILGYIFGKSETKSS